MNKLQITSGFMVVAAMIVSLNLSAAVPMVKGYKGTYAPRDPLPPDRAATLAEMAKLKPSEAWVEKRGGFPVLIVDGEPRPVCVYKGAADFRMMGESDTDIVITHCCGQRLLRSMFFDRALFDRTKGKWDFTAVEDVLLRIYHANPRARVILNVDVDPDRIFLDDHPDEIFRGPDGVRGTQGGPGISSSQFGGFHDELGVPPCPTNNMVTWAYCYSGAALRKRVDEGIGELMKFLHTTPASNIIIGFSVVGGMDGQFVQWEWGGERGNFDYSPAGHRSLRGWLKSVYGTDAALQQAWGDPSVTLENAVNPTVEELKSRKVYDDRPGLGRKLADCRRFVSVGLAQQLNHFARGLKKGFGRPCVTMTWYTSSIWAQPSRLSIDEFIAGGAFDIINTVSQYSYLRKPGGLGASANNLIAGLGLRNLIFMQEMDHRTWRSQVNSDLGVKAIAWPKDLDEFSAQIERDCGAVLAVGGQGWNFFDMFDSWYHDEGVVKLFKRMNALNAFVISRYGKYPRPEVAVFSDEKTRLFAPSVSNGELNLFWRTSGITPDQYYLTDLTNDALPSYRLIVVSAPITLTKAQANRLAAFARGGSKVVIFGDVAIASREFADRAEVEKVFAGLPRVSFVGSVGEMTPEWLNRTAVECGIHTYSPVGNVVTVGNGVAAVHRLEGQPAPMVDFGREVTLFDPTTGEKTPGVRIWQPAVETNRSAVTAYLW